MRRERAIRGQLLQIARTRGEDFNRLLIRYAQERLLYRLSTSPHRDQFVLKGALLFVTWAQVPHRPTRDLDLLGRGDPDGERLARIFKELCGQALAEADGLHFDPMSVRWQAIREDAVYDGVRLTLKARLGSAHVHLQVDVGFGDSVLPGPELVRYPSLLDLPQPVLDGYPREVVIAEKIQAAVELGMINSRMKDLFDVRHLALAYEFEGIRLAQALAATFERRATGLPATEPEFLTEAFALDRLKRQQWSTFLSRNQLSADADLGDVIALVHRFVMPPFRALAAGGSFTDVWPAGGPWRRA